MIELVQLPDESQSVLRAFEGQQGQDSHMLEAILLVHATQSQVSGPAVDSHVRHRVGLAVSLDSTINVCSGSRTIVQYVPWPLLLPACDTHNQPTVDRLIGRSTSPFTFICDAVALVGCE